MSVYRLCCIRSQAQGYAVRHYLKSNITFLTPVEVPMDTCGRTGISVFAQSLIKHWSFQSWVGP